MVSRGYRVLRAGAMRLLLLLLVSLGMPAPAQDCDVHGLAEIRMYHWMYKLALKDWKIELQVVDAETLPRGEMGHTRMVVAAKVATISIPDRSAYGLPCGFRLDLAEAGVLHELVHIRLAPAFEGDRTERSKQAEENAVVALTMTLIDEVRR